MKRIYHLGAWNRNYGDYALEWGVTSELQRLSDQPLQFIPIDCQRTYFHHDLINMINRTGDMLLVGGGGLVFHRPEDSSKSGWQFNIAVEDLERLTVPLVIYGIGYNRFYYDQSGFRPVINEHLPATQRKAALFSVRDEGSREALEQFGVDLAGVEVIPDPGAFIKPQPLTLPGLDADKLNIGLNWAGDRPHYRFPDPWEASQANFIATLSQALNDVLDARGGGSVVYIPHLVEGIDRAAFDAFKTHLGDRLYDVETARADIFPPSFAQVPFLADIYRQMDIAIGMRGHANIVSFAVGTMPIGIGSHKKNRFFLDQIGLPENVISAQDDSLNWSVAGFRKIIDSALDDEGKRKTMETKRQELTAIAENFNRRVLALLA